MATAKRRGPGRPPVAPDEKRKVTGFRLSNNELAQVAQLAGMWACTSSEAVRRAVADALEREQRMPTLVVASPAADLERSARASATSTDKCTDCSATAPTGTDGWEVDFPDGKRRARCPFHSTRGRMARARAGTNTTRSETR